MNVENEKNANTILRCDFWEHPEWAYGDSTHLGVFNMINSLLDNSIHEHMLGKVSNISIMKHLDDSYSVSDDGQSMPLSDAKDVFLKIDSEMAKKKTAALADAVPYPVYTHGKGLFMLNTFSESVVAIVHNDTGNHYVRFTDGSFDFESPLDSEENMHGTFIRFWPNHVFTDTNVPVKELVELAKDLCAVFPRLTVSVGEETTPNQYVDTIIRYPNGVEDYLMEALGTTLHGPIHRKTWNGQVRDGAIDELYDLSVEIVLCETTEPKTICFHNHKPIPGGYWERHSGNIVAEARLYTNKKFAVAINTVSSKASYTTGDKRAVGNTGIVKAVRELLLEAIAEMSLQEGTQ